MAAVIFFPFYRLCDCGQTLKGAVTLGLETGAKDTGIICNDTLLNVAVFQYIENIMGDDL